MVLSIHISTRPIFKCFIYSFTHLLWCHLELTHKSHSLFFFFLPCQKTIKITTVYCWDRVFICLMICDFLSWIPQWLSPQPSHQKHPLFSSASSKTANTEPPALEGVHWTQTLDLTGVSFSNFKKNGSIYTASEKDPDS